MTAVAGPAHRGYRRLRRATRGPAIARAVYRLDTPTVALSFDDGPHPTHTHEVLDLLAAARVRATFFLVGRNARAHPSVVRRMLDEGHTIGSHSLTHPEPWTRSPAALWHDYRAGHLEVSDVVGRDVRLFRPPNGFLERRSALVVRAVGLDTRLWNVDAADWEPDLRSEDVVDRLGRSRPGDIVLAVFLERAQRAGVSFAPLT